MTREELYSQLATISQLVAGAIAVLYLIGFIGLNAYYVSNGIYSFEFFNVQILAAGILFSSAYGIYGFVVGRRLFYIDKDRKAFMEDGANYRFPSI